MYNYEDFDYRPSGGCNCDLKHLIERIIRPYTASDEMLEEGMVCYLSIDQQKAIVEVRNILRKAKNETNI